jgi:hypothetical protein
LTDDFLSVPIIQVLELFWSGTMLFLDFIDTLISEYPHKDKVTDNHWNQEQIREHVEPREVRDLLKIEVKGRKRRGTDNNTKCRTEVSTYILEIPGVPSKLHTKDNLPIVS